MIEESYDNCHPRVAPAGFLREHLESASPDLLRQMVKTSADALIRLRRARSAAPTMGNAATIESTPRNSLPAPGVGYSGGTVELAIPKLRTGSYFPDWLLHHRRWAEQAVVSVVATTYPLGVEVAGGDARRDPRRRVAVQVASLGNGGAP
jgi:putative transposase